uniref:DUF362 domain-containing protein n=1 Tax=Candidatus Electronema sp. TaxID=2698783 RepID=UPI004057054D
MTKHSLQQNSRLKMLRCRSAAELNSKLAAALDSFRDIFPADPQARILLKPNLNSNMNALTGNTTDLRLLAAALRFLKEAGYQNITIGEGTNSGFYRSGISVITRLRVDALAKHFGVRCVDLNYSQPVLIPFADGVQAGIAKECAEAEFFINLPKLKTHFEAGMTVCLKNLIGCLVGQENKKKTHLSLADNIVSITESCRPHLHIVDGLVAMEGLGPTKGTPVRTDTVFVGDNPYFLDLIAARFTSCDIDKISPLNAARRRGLISGELLAAAKAFPLEEYERPFAPPKAGPLASFIHHPKRQKYFLAIRNTRFFNWACNTELVGKLLFMTDLRQDVFLDEEMACESLSVAADKCDGCGKCAAYCPLGLALPEALSDPACIRCLYCFCVCPRKAIEFHGKLGFMAEQLKQYDEIIRRLA